ncbi:MAG: sugar ABC transporter ATP-binding protein [Streptomycetaceae bacterium]|nr:MAG: sugar ABC transporter ATP-binding protein [Streptomycetaceae bacterium]
MTTTAEYSVEVRNIRKAFGSVDALRDVSLYAKPGEVTAIVGDNGAGKSTLIKCISGVYKADDGEIFINGEPVSFTSPEESRSHGIETVYQTLGLVEDLAIWQNLFLNREAVKGFGPFKFLDKNTMRQRSTEMLANLDVYIPSVKSRVRGLSGGQRQAVAICRATGWGSHVVIMDEPTAALGVKETAKVETLIHRLKSEGIAILLISHNFDQVLRLAEHIWVMRQGNVMAGMRAKDTNGDELVALITGASAGRK